MWASPICRVRCVYDDVRYLRLRTAETTTNWPHYKCWGATVPSLRPLPWQLNRSGLYAAPVPGEALVCAWVPFTSPRPAPSPEQTNCNTQKQTPPPHQHTLPAKQKCALTRRCVRESDRGSSRPGNLPLTVSYVMFFHQVPVIRILWVKVPYQQSLVHTWRRSWCPLVHCKDLLHRNPEEEGGGRRRMGGGRSKLK